MNLNLLPLAASVSLAWDASPEATNYKLYVGIQSMKAGNPPLMGYGMTGTTYTVVGLDYGTEYYFCVTALKDGLESGYSNEVTYLVAPPPPQTIWPALATPVRADAGADSPVELGVRFISDVSGVVVGVRFYKSAGNTGTHSVSLWNAAGVRMASATATNETTSGWQSVYFSVPVVITGGLTYTASYRCPNGHYAADWDAFAAGRSVNSGALHAPTGINGVYRYGTPSVFPNQVYRNTNYWVDILFSP